MKAVTAYVDNRDGLLCALVDGHVYCYESEVLLAEAVHRYGFEVVIGPPSDESWPDYAHYDAHLYERANAELRRLRLADAP